MKKVLIFLLVATPILIFGQCIDGDCNKGDGKYKFKNGTYVGQFLDGQLNGKGVFSTKRGYSYDGSWSNGIKSGLGNEVIKKELVYDGEFLNNKRHGKGVATFANTKYMQDLYYSGEWNNGEICGEGEFIYSREVKYGRVKVVERNHLVGSFVNGVYQGRITSPYSDELEWKSFGLKMEDFQKYQSLTERQRKTLKNPATIDGSIVLSCECLSNILIFDASAILRKESSWWSTEDVPPKTKQTVLNTRQREFDIVEWHARALELELNKKKLPCNLGSMAVAWSALSLIEKECSQTRKIYTAETGWNPKKGVPKNKKPQEKWDNKISKKLKDYEKRGEKFVSKLRKKLSKKEAEQCLAAGPGIMPIKKEESSKGDVVAKQEKASKEKKSYRPTFPRAHQLK